MTEELNLPVEGMPTIVAQFTRGTMDKIVGAIADLKRKGWPENRIYLKLKEEMASMNPRNLKRIFDLGVGNPIEDDVTEENVAGEEPVSETKVRVRLKKLTEDVDIDLIVHYKGQEWYVAGFNGTDTFTLKRID